jgi:hypothetical protein
VFGPLAAQFLAQATFKLSTPTEERMLNTAHFWKESPVMVRKLP